MYDLDPSDPDYSPPLRLTVDLTAADLVMAAAVQDACMRLLNLCDQLGKSHELSTAKGKIRDVTQLVAQHLAQGEGEEGLGIPESLRSCGVSFC